MTAPGAKPSSKTSTAHDYHNFSDNFHPDWDFAGNAKLIRFGMDLGWQVITSKKPITWNKGDEFEAARLASEKSSNASKIHDGNFCKLA
jgi:hypothetical protein